MFINKENEYVVKIENGKF